VPSIDDPEVGESTAPALVTNEGSAVVSMQSTQRQAPPQFQPQPQQLMPQPQPQVVSRRAVGSPFIMAPTQLQAPDNMSVRVINTSPYFACISSGTFGSGDSIFKLRLNDAHGSYEQDFLPSSPAWTQVGCPGVLMPNMTENTETGPEAWLAVNRVGTFNLIIRFYTFDGVDPQYTGITTQQSLTFPNSWRKNPHCPKEWAKGCLHNFPLRASAEISSGDTMLAALEEDVLFLSI
jgi:hypothetical protein